MRRWRRSEEATGFPAAVQPCLRSSPRAAAVSRWRGSCGARREREPAGTGAEGEGSERLPGDTEGLPVSRATLLRELGPGRWAPSPRRFGFCLQCTREGSRVVTFGVEKL